MSERKAWSQQEDKVLKLLREQRAIAKWTEISRLMSEEFQLQGRSGKQCRQRYHNHLDTSIKRQQWLGPQQTDLIELHNFMGNRWAEISRALTGRSQNCVKNKFYSILRRGLRYINLVIKKHLKKYKELDIKVIYKLIEACEVIYKRKHPNREMQINLDLKKQIIFYGMLKEKQPELDKIQEDIEKIKKLVDQLKRFSKINHNKKQMSSSQDEKKSQKEKADQVQQIYVFKPQPKKTSLQSMLSDVDPISSGRSKYSSYPLDTIKSLEYPQFEPIKQPPLLIMLQSIYFQNCNGKTNNYSSFTQLMQN